MELERAQAEVCGGLKVLSQLQILYVAFGYTYLVQAINSVRTLRKSGTDASVKLITNLPVKDVYIVPRQDLSDRLA